MAKSKWDKVKDKLILVEGWARDGLTDEQIANNLGINVATLYRYKKQHFLKFFIFVGLLYFSIYPISA